MNDNTAIKKRVLIADDVESLAELMKQILSAQGYEVMSAPDGEACLEMVGSFKPDLIILDIMMPKIHGIDILKRIKADEKTQHIGVIICTAKDYKTDRDQLIELGATYIITKPFAKEDMITNVANYFTMMEAHEVVEQAPQEKRETVPQYKPVIDKKLHAIKLWGTRGSTPVSNPNCMRHGGNTPCLSIETGDEMVIIDAGSGIRELGIHLMSSNIRKLHIFIGHTHWDHIQGFPFFTPAYVPGYELVIYGASGFGKNMKSIFKGQLDSDYFPVQLEDMHSKMEFKTLTDSPVRIGDVDIFWNLVNHPGATIGFKIGIGDKRIGYITDDEFLQGYTGTPRNIPIDDKIVEPYRKTVEFVAGVDILIHEAQYTNDEYPAKVGWGHSSVSNACLLAKLAGTKKWIVTHHDPMYDDDFLTRKLVLTKQILQELECPIEVENAFDGMILYL